MICAIFSGIVLFPSYFTHGCHPRRKSYQIWGNPIFIGTEATAGFQPLSCNCRWREREWICSSQQQNRFYVPLIHAITRILSVKPANLPAVCQRSRATVSTTGEGKGRKNGERKEFSSSSPPPLLNCSRESRTVRDKSWWGVYGRR